MRTIFVNLPVTDLDRATAFYAALGFRNDARYTDETGAAMVVEENILVMLLTREKFAGFVAGEVGDPAQATSVLNAISAADRAECDDLLSRALAAGGKPWQPAQDHGFMYGTSFTDPDGNVWEAAWMDPAALEG
ncbi:VOC family protein [Modestobacter sp. VKM Ac-2979]|uniref:VOC family protein n=1 Tax=unclassified Modestobacter TaxID=2643866 RepID=UPI0022AB6831|nr:MULTISPECIES: VOC family protein [unclassified Modestobacter]MCZ2811188.1 VOC family protein [Modestobacter sp. VKM Ac-2979]MCZ2840701.1 VOC family protein [Modestobacter sp. VKM Ac-2980]